MCKTASQLTVSNGPEIKYDDSMHINILLYFAKLPVRSLKIKCFVSNNVSSSFSDILKTLKSWLIINYNYEMKCEDVWNFIF